MVVTVILIFLWICGAQGEYLECERPPLVVPEDCCTVPQFFPNEVLRKCSENYSKVEYQPPSETPRTPPLPAPLLKSITAVIPRGVCVFECAFNVTGINQIFGMDMTDISNYFKNIAANNTFNDTMIEALEECIRDTHSKLQGFMAIAKMPPNRAGQKYCNPMAGYLMICLHSFFFQKCPESLWKQSTECNELREYRQKCPLPFGVKKTK